MPELLDYRGPATQKGDYILRVKANQGSLEGNLRTHFKHVENIKGSIRRKQFAI